MPPPRPFLVETTLAGRVTVTREAGAGNGFRTSYLFHFLPAGNRRDKYRNNISVYHNPLGTLGVISRVEPPSTATQVPVM